MIEHRSSLQTRNVALAAAIALAVPAAAQGQSAGAAQDTSFRLGVVEVIGERVNLEDEVRVDIVSEEAIEKHDTTDVAEALDLLPGVTAQNVGNRSERLVFVRGFNSRQVPLYVDGIPVYVPYDGNIDLGRFLTADISEIVVTKGLTSVLYGPNSLGGSINIVTRRPSEGFQGRVRGAMDFDDDFDHSGSRADFSLGLGQDKWYAQLSGAWRDRDYFLLPGDFEPTPVQPKGKRINSASEDNTLNLRIGLTPRGDDEYAISVIRQRGDKQTPPYAGTTPGVRARYWRWPVYDKDSLYFLSRTGIGSDVTLRLRAYKDKFDNTLESYDDATFTTQDRPYAFTSIYDDETYGAGADLEWQVGERQVFRAAASYKSDKHNETDDIGEPWERFEDKIWSIAAEYQFGIGSASSLTTGLSFANQEGQRADQKLPDGSIVPFETGSTDAVNGQVVLTHSFSDTLSGFAGYARKTRFPTIKDRYTSRFGSALPNPELDPETSDNYELGLEGTSAALTWKAALFHSRLKDAIESVSIPDSACTSPPCTQFQNIAEQRNQGIELSAQLALGEAWTLAGNYTWLDRENTSEPDILPLDTPEHSALLWVEWKPLDGLSLMASGEYSSSRNSTTDGLRVADGFTTFALRGRWLFDSGLEVSAGIENVADKLYAYEEGYYEPGRRYNVGLGYRF
jgi:iron complex outermembrane receptor protein